MKTTPRTVRFGQAILVVGLVALAPLSGRTDSPKITMKLTGATAVEALDAISKVAGQRIDSTNIRRAQGDPGKVVGNAPPTATEKADFNWDNTSFARAFREVCTRFNLRPYRNGATYVINPSFQAPEVPVVRRVGLVEKAGIKLFARRSSINDYRSVNFMGGDDFGGGGNLSLEIGAELGDLEADSIAGFANVSARDDTGGILTSDQNRYGGGYYGNSAFPDEWTGSVGLAAPGPKAKKLEWLEGDLMVYRSVKSLKAEVPLPLTGKSVRRQIGDVLLVVSGVEVAGAKPEEKDDDEADLPDIGRVQRVNTPGIRIRVRAYTPNQPKVTSRGYNYQPVLIRPDGSVVQSNMSNSSGWGNGEMSLQDMQLNFPIVLKPGEAIGTLAWDLVERGDVVKLMSFRMTDIPIPQPGQIIPRRKPVARSSNPVPADTGDRGPYYERGGGSLTMRVEIGGKAAGDGSLQVGLAMKEGAEFAAIRWSEAVVGADGLARVDDLKPGVYRVLRRFKPRNAGPLDPQGKWLNSEAQVTVTAGKESPLPPLRWAVTAAAPTTPTRPAVRMPIKR